MTPTRPRGIYPILYAFFDDTGALDRDAFRRQIEACIASGAHGIAILGLITEVSALTPGERETLVRWAVEDIGGRVPLMATIAGRDAAEAGELAVAAERAGADYLILQPPLGSGTTTALSDFYADIMPQVSLPVGIQNAPEYLGVGLDVDELVALRRRCDNFTIMKGEGPAVTVKRYIDALGSDFDVFNGRGGLELPDMILAGAAGMIPAPDCADIQVAIFNAVEAGDLERAMALYQRILPYIVFAMQTIDAHILYGKQVFARRAGIANASACRVPKEVRQPFFEVAGTRWSESFGPYGGASF